VDYLTDGGSFALMSGVLADDPIIMGSVASSVNGAIQAFTRAAAIELPRGIRINNIAPTILAEAKPGVIALFPGEIPVPAFEVGQAYVKAIHGAHTGQTIRVGYVPGGK
jgi:NAD(P)-dependent dehydrogenase (short-subunit alcohol dehydrogenase family)